MFQAAEKAIKQPPPRRVSWNRVGWGCKIGMIFGFFFFIGWGMFILTKEPTAWDHFILNKRGITSPARLVRFSRVPGVMNRKPVYSIELSFKDREGRPVRTSLWSYDTLFMAQINTDRPIAIEYDPQNPARSRFAGITIDFMDIAGFISCAVGLSLFVGSFISARSRLRLFRNGTETTGRVTRISATSQSRKSGTIINVSYEFTTDAGKPAAGFYQTTKPPKEGKEIVIVYDPRRPWKNAPE
jgi:hypothetical protein